MEPVKCIFCRKEAEEKSVECGYCGGWIHWDCLGIKPEGNSLEHPNILVFSVGCKLAFEKHKNGETGVKERKSKGGNKGGSVEKTGNKSGEHKAVGWADLVRMDEQQNERFSRLEGKVDTLVKSLGPILGQIRNPTTPQLQPGILSYAEAAGKGIGGGGKVVTMADVRNMQQEDILKKSLVVKGLPEMGNDLEDVKEMCRELDISSQVVAAFRMGLKRRPVPRSGLPPPRLLKVHMASSSCQRSILQEARNLRNSGNFNGCYIRKSMSKEERASMAKLYRKRDDLNKAEGEQSRTKYVVMNEAVIKFKNCERKEDGWPGRGVRDYQFKWTLEDDETCIDGTQSVGESENK